MKDSRCHIVYSTLLSSVAAFPQRSCSIYLGQQNFTCINAYGEHQNVFTCSAVSKHCMK